MQLQEPIFSTYKLCIEPPEHLINLASHDVACMSRGAFLEELNHPDTDALRTFCDSWDALAQDTHMADGGTYRLRRHAVFSASRAGGTVRREDHQPHYQTNRFNRLNGGIERHFEPVDDQVAQGHILQQILDFSSRTFGALSPMYDWHIEVHQFRILAQPSGGKPTPEGVHRDGVDYVLMVMISRENIVGGETRVLDLNDHEVARFTLSTSFEAVLVNDLRAFHGVSPISPYLEGEAGHRDMLVVTFKRK